jgi:Uma2 family endonuclease
MFADTLRALLSDPAAPFIVEAAAAALAEEQRRRYEFRDWVSDEIKAEFINGEVVLHSPVRRQHLEASAHLYRLLSAYVDLHQLGAHGHEKAMVSLTRNDYEPDICYWSQEKSRTFHAETMLHPAPDFAVEILSRRTARTDRVIKYSDYARHGVKEYWIIDPKKQLVEQYVLATPSDRTYTLQGKYGTDGEVHSISVPGFTVPVSAVFDKEANMAALRGMMQEK